MIAGSVRDCKSLRLVDCRGATHRLSRSVVATGRHDIAVADCGREGVPRVAEQRRRRVRTAERPVVAHIDPGSPCGGLALGEDRHRRVVGVQPLRRQHMRRYQVVQRSERHRARAQLVDQRRQAQIDAFASVAIALAVQRLVRPILLEQDHRQQVGARPAPRRRMERRRRPSTIDHSRRIPPNQKGGPQRRVTPECDEDEEQYNEILKRIAPTTNDQMMVPT